MTLKKKIEIAVILCSIGICSFGQNVFAGEFLRLPAQTNAKVEQVVQTRLLEEQKSVPYAGTAYDESQFRTTD